MSEDKFHALLDTVLQVNFPSPRDEDSLKDRFKTASNDVILRLFHEIVLDTERDALFEDTERDALFDKLVGLLQAVDDKHVDTPNVEGVTLLMQVADFKYLHGFVKLIDAGANPNAFDSTGRSVLHRVVSKEQCDFAKQLKCEEIIKSMLKKLQACPRFRINPTVSSYNNGKRTYLYALKEHNALLAEYFPQRVTCDDIDLFIAAENAKPSSTTVAEYMRDTRLDLIDICIRTNTYGPNLRSFNINDQFDRLEPNVVPRDKCTLLHWAIAREASDSAIFVRYLLNAGANPNVWCSDMQYHTALMMALDGTLPVAADNQNKQEIVRVLSNIQDIDLNVIDGDVIDGGYGRTALHYAVEHNLHEVVLVLLSAGALPNVQTEQGGWTALHVAVDNNNLNMVKTLLSAGALPNITDNAKETALNYAINSEVHGSLSTRETLRKHIRKRDIIKTLLEAHSNPNIRNARGQTALHCAVKNRMITIYEQLFKHGADPCVQDDKGQTILHYAAKNTEFDMASESAPWLATLVDAVRGPPDVDIQDNNGQTALHVAVISNHVFMIQYLLKVDANLNVQDKGGWTALHYAVDKDNLHIVKTLLSAGALPNVQDNGGDTALMLAAEGNNLDLATALMNHPRIDVNVQDEQGDTALMVAAHNDHLDLVAALMNHPGIDLNVQDKGGRTALHWAVYTEDVSLVAQLLTGKNIDTSLVETMNRTPLQVAIWNGYLECVKILQEHEQQKHDRLLKKRSREEEGGGGRSKRLNTGGSSKRRNRNTKTQSVIKLPFSKLKL